MSEFVEVKLASLVNASRPITYGIVQPGPDVSPGGVPLIRGKDYSSGKVDASALYHVLPEIDRPYARSKVQEGDLLLSIVGYVGQIAQVPKELAGANITQTTARISIDPGKAYSKFVFHYLSSPHFRPEITRYEKGSAQPGLNLADVERLKIYLPDLRVQKSIAEILSTLDEAIEQTEALIAKMQQVKSGLMHDLFTRGVTPDGRLRPTREQSPELYKKSPLGWIPKVWEAEKLGDILRRCGGYLQTGPFGSQLHAHEYQVEGVPVVMPQDINNGLIDTEQIARIYEQRANDLARHRMSRGDIVIARRGDLSRAAAISKAEQGWVCGTGCFLLRLGQSSLSADFAAYVYRQDFVQRQIAGRAVGTTMPSLNNSVMAGLFFPFCNKDEQARIVERLEGVERSIRVLNEGLLVIRQIKHGLMHNLLTGKVRVQQ